MALEADKAFLLKAFYGLLEARLKRGQLNSQAHDLVP
jgi:hypothetical protein